MRGSSMVAHDADIVAHVKRIEDENVLRLYFTKLRDVSRVEGRAIDFVAEVNYPKVRTPKENWYGGDCEGDMNITDPINVRNRILEYANNYEGEVNARLSGVIVGNIEKYLRSVEVWV